MSIPASSSDHEEEIVRHALNLLLRASEYASDVRHDVWDFAVEIRRLEALGVAPCDLRWLICKGLVEHAIETSSGECARRFGRAGGLSFDERSCFVLTEQGIQTAQDMLAALHHDEGMRAPISSPDEARPQWNSNRRELSISGRVVKRYRVPAPNQELILNAFAEDGWPGRIDDPLPPNPDLEPKRRLQAAITCLNRNQKERLIHFRGDGRGVGICWEPVIANY